MKLVDSEWEYEGEWEGENGSMGDFWAGDECVHYHNFIDFMCILSTGVKTSNLFLKCISYHIIAPLNYKKWE